MKKVPQKFVISIRIRPILQQDRKTYQGKQIDPTIVVNNLNSLTIQRKRNDEKIFTFNYVFSKETQAEIYQNSAHLVNAVFQGHNATFLAYGQTGTGKTFTVFGGKDTNQKGYFHRAVDHIFTNIRQKMHSRQFAVRISFIEFYLDNIYDLIDNNNKKLQIKETAQDGIHIKQLSQIPVKSTEELLGCVKAAIANRKTQQTSINKKSSRSHAVVQIQVLQRWNQNNETFYQKGILKIVDLAGSQRVSKTESFGPRLQEAKRINKEITTLGKCINLLAQNQKQHLNSKSDISSKFNFHKSHIPYRDSKITRFLADTLDGKSKIMLCVCVSQLYVHIDQTFSSLMFAMQASTLKVESRRNQVYSLKKSVEKTSKSFYETPLKSKSQIKQNKGDEDKKKTDEALKNLLQEIEQIECYLQGGGVSTKGQEKEYLQKNLVSYEKIFKIMKNKLDRQSIGKKQSSKFQYD